MWTPEDRELFELFGFRRIRDALTEDEVAALDREANALLANAHGPGFRGVYQEQMATAMTPDSPHLATMLEDPRLVDPVFSVLGEDALGALTSVHRFVGATEWHSDERAQGLRAMKVICYLEPLTAQTGALRIVPGSHLRPYLDEEKKAAMMRDPDEVPAFVCETSPRDLLVFDMRVWHGSFGGSEFRRNIQWYYFEYPHTDAQRAAVEKLRGEPHEEMEGRDFWHPDWRDDPHRSALRARWVRDLAEVGLM